MKEKNEITSFIIKSDMKKNIRMKEGALDLLQQFLNRIGLGSGRSRTAAPGRLAPEARRHLKGARNDFTYHKIGHGK